MKGAKLLWAVESELGSEVNGGDVPVVIYFFYHFFLR